MSGKIIPKNHIRILEERPKNVGEEVTGRPQTTEQSTARKPVDAPSKGVMYVDLTKRYK